MSARTPLLVGLVLVAATASLTWFVMLTSKDKYGEDSTYVVYADFTDASGIRWKTRVQINGIDVGKIDDIEHVPTADGRLVARVKIRLLDDYRLYDNAAVRKAAESLLGDYRLDLDPGTPDRPPIPEGGVIGNVQSVSDMEEIQLQLKQVAANVNQVTDSFKRVLSGPEGEGSLKQILANVERSMAAIEQVSTALGDAVGKNDQAIQDTLQGVGAFANRLEEVSGPTGDLTQLTQNLNRLSQRMNQIADVLGEMVEVEGGTTGEEESVRHTLQNLNQSIAHLNEISRKIDEGQGTAGRLINDPGIAEKVEQTLDDTSEIIGSLSRLETELELRSEYAVPFGDDNELVQAAIKNTLGLRIRPKPDKYYLIEAIADPRGKQRRTLISRGAPGQEPDSVVEKTVIAFDDLKFSAEFAKRYWFLTLRFGIIENTGGLGADFHFLDDNLELRLDVFDFTRSDPLGRSDIFPRLRTLAMYEFLAHLFVQAGLDDPLNPRLRTWFVGGALRFTDDDLKALLTVAPTP